jgi:leader peptidase (prepilin peptidase)/N-methyltransferase
MPSLALDAFAVLAGACVGSFVATAAVRAARGEGFVVGRSHCDSCGVELGFAETLPVVSFIRRRGVCAACGARIDPIHPLGELSGAAIGLACVSLAPFPSYLLAAALGLTLLASAVVDARTRRLPDVLTLAALALAAILSLLHCVKNLEAGLVAAAIAFGLLELVRRSFLWLRRKPGLGFGDVKLAAALAIWLGAATAWAVVIASVLGLIAFAVARPRDGRLPFGPMLALAGFAVGLMQEAGLWPRP